MHSYFSLCCVIITQCYCVDLTEQQRSVNQNECIWHAASPLRLRDCMTESVQVTDCVEPDQFCFSTCHLHSRIRDSGVGWGIPLAVLTYILIGHLPVRSLAVRQNFPQDNAVAPYVTRGGELAVGDGFWCRPSDRDLATLREDARKKEKNKTSLTSVLFFIVFCLDQCMGCTYFLK